MTKVTVDCLTNETIEKRLTIEEINKRLNLESSESRLKSIREKRNKLLLECDWTQLADVPLTPEKRAEWATYRQALRDITKQDLTNVVFPNKPI